MAKAKSAKKYSNFRATLAIARASLINMFRNPSSIIFGLVFPLVMVGIFGFVGNTGIKIKVGLVPGSNAENPIYSALSEMDSVSFATDLSENEITSELNSGKLDASLEIKTNDAAAQQCLAIYPAENCSQVPANYEVKVTTSDASPQNGQAFYAAVKSLTDSINIASANISAPAVNLSTENLAGREYKSIDFILPGQLGFSVLSIGVMGTAFTFLSLRQTLVLKRFYATPIRRGYIVLGEGLSKLTFSLVQTSVIIAIGAIALDFTLINGLMTFLMMMSLVALGLIVFMGVGFVVSSIAPNENVVAPLANLFTLPQFLLSGTFFSTDFFPKWLQYISKALPLTYLNDALRQIAFEGASFWDVRTSILVLLAWGVGIYIIAIRVFKWE